MKDTHFHSKWHLSFIGENTLSFTVYLVFAAYEWFKYLNLGVIGLFNTSMHCNKYFSWNKSYFNSPPKKKLELQQK